MKYIRNILLSLVGIYILSLVFISIDINDSRPFVSLFKKLQTDSALEVVDFSVEKKDSIKPEHQLFQVSLQLTNGMKEVLITLVVGQRP